MNGGYGGQGVLADAYGAAFGGGQRFFTWTNDAFNPTAWGVSTRMAPASAPELVGGNVFGGSSSGLLGSLANVPTWSILQSPVPWVLLFLIVGIPLYHYIEYGSFSFFKKKE